MISLRMMFPLILIGMVFQNSDCKTVAEEVKTPKVKIEFRLAQDLPGKGLTEVTLPGKGRGQKIEAV